MTQKTLFDTPKLSRQQALVFELFKRATRVSNGEMNEVCMTYRNRLSELRKKGIEIRPVAKGPRGVVWYEWLNRYGEETCGS